MAFLIQKSILLLAKKNIIVYPPLLPEIQIIETVKYIKYM